MPVLVEDATAAITQRFSDLIHLTAIVRREREMVQADAPSMVASTYVRVWRLNQHKVEPVHSPTPPFSPRLEWLVAEQLQKPVPEMRRSLKVGDVELDMGKHHLSPVLTAPSVNQNVPRVTLGNEALPIQQDQPVDPLKGSGQVDRLVSFGPPVFLYSNLPYAAAPNL
jgi:hypothetical protein